MKTSARLFVAAQLPQNIINEINVAASNIQPHVRGSFSPPQNYHITLAFLGDMPLSLVDDIKHAIATGSGMLPIRVRLDGLGSFGKPANAILWAGVTPTAPVIALGNAVRTQLDALGMRYDPKPVRPHITIARKADVTGVDLNTFAPQPLHFTIDRVTLFMSHRVNGILTYTPL